MGLMNFIFGSGRNVIAETAQVFRPNAENSAQRAADHATAALSQYAAEFHQRRNRNWIDALADGLNRLVRPVVTAGLLYPIPATVIAPEQMAKVWTAMATLPPGYWAIVGIVLPFYFGGRMQMKSLAASGWRATASAAAAFATPATLATDPSDNAALDGWWANGGG